MKLPLEAKVDLKVHELEVLDLDRRAQHRRQPPCQDLGRTRDEAEAALCPERQARQQVPVLAFFRSQDGRHLTAIVEDALQGAFQHVEHPDASVIFKEDIPEQRGQEGW